MDPLTFHLAQLENAQLVRRAHDPELAYLFKHALTQESAYGSLLLKTRRGVHRHVAQAYEQLYADQLDEYAAVLMAHYAEAGDDEKTFAYAIRAGDIATRLSAYTEARHFYAAALEALSRLADTEQNRRERIHTILKQINVAWGIDTTELNLKRLFEAESQAQSLPDLDRASLMRIHYWMGRIYSYSNQHRQAALYYEEMLTEARETGDDELIALAAAGAGRTLFLQGYFGSAVALLREAIPYLERVGNWPEWVLAKVSLAISLGAQGHFEEGRTHGDEAIQKALWLNDRTSIASARGMAARVDFMAGELDRLFNVTEMLVEEAEGANPLVRYMVLGFKAWVESRLGMDQAARASMAETDVVASQFGTRLIYDDWFAAARAEIELNAGQYERALVLAEQAVRVAQVAGGVFGEGIAQRVWGQALAAVDGAENAQCEAHLEKSLRLFEEGDAVVEAARTHVAWGKVLMTRGNTQAAREHFEHAVAQFTAVGLTRELQEGRDLIASLPNEK